MTKERFHHHMNIVNYCVCWLSLSKGVSSRRYLTHGRDLGATLGGFEKKAPVSSMRWKSPMLLQEVLGGNSNRKSFFLKQQLHRQAACLIDRDVKLNSGYADGANP